MRNPVPDAQTERFLHTCCFFLKSKQIKCKQIKCKQSVDICINNNNIGENRKTRNIVKKLHLRIIEDMGIKIRCKRGVI